MMICFGFHSGPYVQNGLTLGYQKEGGLLDVIL